MSYAADMQRFAEEIRALKREVDLLRAQQNATIIGRDIQVSNITRPTIEQPTITEPVITGGVHTGSKHITPVLQGDVKFQVDDDDSAPATWSKTDDSKEVDMDSTVVKNAAISTGSTITETIARAHEANFAVDGSKLAVAVPNAKLGSDIDAGKLTAGTLPIARIAAGAVVNTKLGSDIDAAKLTTGTLPIARIAAGDIDNTKIASGVDAAKLTTGTLPIARIGAGAIVNTKLGSDIDAAKVTTGTLPIARIGAGAVVNSKIGSDVDAGKLTAGTLPVARIGAGTILNAKLGSDLDGGKIASGTVADARLPSTMDGKTFSGKITTQAGLDIDGDSTLAGGGSGILRHAHNTPQFNIQDSSGVGVAAASALNFEDSNGSDRAGIQLWANNLLLNAPYGSMLASIITGESFYPTLNNLCCLGNASFTWKNIFFGATDILSIMMIGSTNATWVPMIMDVPYFIGGAPTTIADRNSIRNIGSTNEVFRYTLPYPATLGGLKLYVTGARVSVYDADGSNFITAFVLAANDYNSTTDLINDGTNKTAQALNEYTLGDTDVGTSYRYLNAQVNTSVADANALDLIGVELLIYYA